jgi:hypothetical protein
METRGINSSPVLDGVIGKLEDANHGSPAEDAVLDEGVQVDREHAGLQVCVV